MSANDAKASKGEQGGQSTDSVYDFLYHDARRVGSFLAQFDSFGHLQQLTAGESATKDAKRGYSLKLAGALPLPGTPEGAEGSMTLGMHPSQGGSESLHRVYDPLWTNARTLLDYLDQKELIQRDLNRARLGQFILASGELSILNAGLLPKIWETSGVRDIAVRSAGETARAAINTALSNAPIRSAERAKAEKIALKVAETNAQAAMDVIALLPHSAQCTIRGSGYSVWSTLNSDGMVGRVSDLSLKHGTEIPGHWSLLGLLDALPSPIPEQLQIPNTGVPTHMAAFIRNLSNLSRTIVGRPPDAYGVTALLLFREVSARSSDS